MAQKYYFKCTECDYTSMNKFFLCPSCGEGTGEKVISSQTISKPTAKKDFKSIEDYKDDLVHYYSTENKKLDETLNGGIAKDSLTILAGPPGVGKSTLLLKIISNLSKKNKCCYITAEETGNQVYNRYKRMKLNNSFKLEHIDNINEIIENTKNEDIIIIDSINTIFDSEQDSMPGSISQIKNCVFKLLEYSKNHHKTIIIVGQVTKDGSMAGPRVLEHMVDTVLFFDYFSNSNQYRILKIIKNRFGSNENIALFIMNEKGLSILEDYSTIFINKSEKTIGTTYVPVMEGKFPIFIEIQSLITNNSSDNSIMQIVGYDAKRLFQLSAIINQYTDIKLYKNNVFVNISNGLKINQPTVDLSIYASILSSVYNKNIQDIVFIGEVGLNGTIKKHMNEDFLIKECKKYFKTVISYSTGFKTLSDVNKLFE